MPLQDTDNLIIGRGTESYKITYEDLKDDLNYTPPPTATVKQPTVIAPPDGAGVGGEVTYTPKTSAITVVGETEIIEGINQDQLVASYSSSVQNDNQGLITVRIGLSAALEAAGVTAITGFWLGYPGSIHASYANRNFSAGLAECFLVGSWSGAGAGDIRTKADIAQTVGEPYFNQDRSFETWWTDTTGLLAQGQPSGGTTATGMAKDGEIYGVIFSAPLVRSTVTDDIDFRFLTYCDLNLSTDEEKANSTSAIGIYDQDGNKVIIYGYDDNLDTKLTLTDSNTYNNADGADTGQPISETFTAGQTVYGQNATGTYGADTAAFSTTLYTGNSSTQTITNGIDLAGPGGLVWIKSRDAFYANSHYLFDSARGGVSSRSLATQTSFPSEFLSPAVFTAWSTDGFTLSSNANTNYATENYVSWTFRRAPGFFDIVTWDGDSVYPREIPHSLGVEPGCIILKQTTDTQPWYVYHKDGNANATFYRANLNTNDAFQNAGSDIWTPTSTSFSPASFYGGNSINESYVAYLFADTPGKIKCGSYTAVSSGATVSTGFKVGWILIKSSDSTGNWTIIDNQRGNSQALYPNSSGEEVVIPGGTLVLDPSDGFTYGGNSYPVSETGKTYVYVAIAEDVVAGEFAPTGTLTADADDNGPTITLTDVTGAWEPGMEVVNNTEVTKTAPGADVLEFVGSTPQDDPDGSVETWGNATWQVSTDSAFTTPMEATKLISNPDTNQVLLETERGPITLAADTEYWVRVKYAATSPDVGSTYSAANHFKTAGAGGGSYGNFSTTLYSGKYNTEDFITTGIDNTNKSLVWVKCRDAARDHQLTYTSAEKDSRGDYFCFSTNTTAALNETPYAIKSLTNSGFSVGQNASTNGGSNSYVAWNFAAAKGFFDVVTYDGNDVSGLAVPHGLGSVPGCIIVKRYSGTGADTANWAVYHKELGYLQHLSLNLTTAEQTIPQVWSAEPTSTEFTVQSSSMTNTSGNQFVAYLFADNPDGGIKCGSYTGTGSSQTIECGFKPGFVITKSSSHTSNWYIADKDRPGKVVYADATTTEQSAAIGFVDNGFTVSGIDNALNASGKDIIYIAIAENTTFFDVNNEEATQYSDLEKRFGIDPTEANLKRLGIAELTEQPTGPVLAYVPKGEEYIPVPDQSAKIEALTSSLSEARSRLASIESDEVNDDAVDTSLITLLGNLNSRLTALEENN